jgi:protein involved in polysaccharide export with SLBB domain
MFIVNADKSMSITRGDAATFWVAAVINGEDYHFKPGDIVRFKVFEKKNCDNVVLKKDTAITEDTLAVQIYLSGEDTKVGEVISKPTDYWYEVELNPDTKPQTIIGYDEDGAKVFKVYPVGAEV